MNFGDENLFSSRNRTKIFGGLSGKDMKIENTDYFVNATAFFRQFPRSCGTEFGEEGFVYIGTDVAVGLRRSSKSVYEVTVLFGGEVATVRHKRLDAAAEFAARAVERAES